MTTTAATPPAPRRWLRTVLLLAAGLLCAGFTALGVWQLQRLEWKEALLARVARGQQAAPTPAPGPAAWPALARETDEYRRLTLHGRFDHRAELLVRASTELGTGHWVLTPLRTDEGHWVWVNRGFVPPDQRDPARREGDARSDAPQDLTGLLRLSEPGGSLLQSNAPAEGRWYSRDVLAMSRQQGLSGPVAPFFIDLVADPAASAAWPRPGLTVLQFSNNHLGYALTWFALAALLAGTVLALLRQETRRRRDEAAALAVPRPH